MMKKIAVIGGHQDQRTEFINRLAKETGHQVLWTPDKREMDKYYGLSPFAISESWKDLYAYTLASFSKRVEQEIIVERLISEGSVLLELCVLKTIFSQKSRSKTENKYQDLMIKGLQNVITSHALSQYDCFVHISNGNQSSFYKALNKQIEKSLELYKIYSFNLNTEENRTSDEILKRIANTSPIQLQKI